MTNGSRRIDERKAAVDACRPGLTAVLGLSAVLNVLALAGSIFMMLVYDMVLPSRNAASLIGLLAILTATYAFQYGVENVRARALRLCGAVLGGRLSDRCAEASRRLTLAGHGRENDPVRDLDSVRTFMSGAGPTAMMDLPWAILFVGILWALHPWLGIVTLAGAVVMAGLTLLTERLVSEPSKRAEEAAVMRQVALEQRRRSVETTRALGMESRIDDQVAERTDRSLSLQERLASITSGLGGASRSLRMLLQSLVLATGAILVIQDKATGGVIFASSILSSRALAPVDVAIANWRGFSAARAAWRRLGETLRAVPRKEARTTLHAPASELAVEAIAVAPPMMGTPTLQGASFVVRAGSAVAVVGPSGGGKTTLLKALCGAWPVLSGGIRLDGASIDQWTSDDLGRHLGWLPQEVGLLEGTISRNIARFDPKADDAGIIAADKAAGAHEMILRLPDGYDTSIGEGGAGLSSGQRQRIGLARALHGDPFLVILDEPAANLDAEGENALVAAIAGIRRRGGICIVSAHRPSVVRICDLALIVRDGRQQAFGPSERVLAPQNVRPAVAGAQTASEASA